MPEVKKILIVEDEQAVGQALVDKMTKTGFKVFWAKNGKEGLSMALEEKPDLILLDIIMPVMDGIAMLKKLRQDNWGEKVPVIVLSNLTEAETTAETLESGVHDYLIKTDWTLEQLAQRVQEKIKK